MLAMNAEKLVTIIEDQKDKNVGLMLLFGIAFGAGHSEIVRFKPLSHVQDGQVKLHGGMGGRPRYVKIETVAQRVVI